MSTRIVTDRRVLDTIAKEAAMADRYGEYAEIGFACVDLPGSMIVVADCADIAPFSVSEPGRSGWPMRVDSVPPADLYQIFAGGFEAALITWRRGKGIVSEGGR